MDEIYPAGPAAVPADLTRPSRAYTQRAWLAVAGLGAFVLLYLALSGWFLWTAYRLFTGLLAGGGDNGGLLGFLAGLGAAFFAVFMLKALFFFRRGERDESQLEITAAEQPQLFAFLHRLADDARAPRPHRVFLSARVNASVSYDLNLLNLLLPSRKNLEIGLGLVNVLTLGELKAVLAHEFGHFAQRSMAVGRWVYVAQQVAGQIISRRDAFDRFLQGLGRVDLRIAWIGWLMQLVVWSIRSLMETLFRGVVLAQRALSREMELQADLVAVSLTGSDALVHALHRLHVADEAWDRTLGFARAEFAKDRPVADLYAVQTRIIALLRGILDQPDYGQVPPLPSTDRGAHRLFKAELAQPPRMWSTHPSNLARENNAKRVYIAAEVEGREAWSLFADAAGLRQRMSAHLARESKIALAPIEDSLQRLDQDFDRSYLDRRYRGAYLGRSAVRHVATAAALYAPAPEPSAVQPELAALYPESLAQALERLRALDEERQALKALHDRVAQPVDGNIRHRGVTLKRRELPRAIAEVDAEILATRQTVEGHDARCRSVHLAAAAQLGDDWRDHLRGLAAILHYADHGEAELRDVQGVLGNVYAIVTADGKVTAKELDRLLRAANDLHAALRGVWSEAVQVVLDPALGSALGVERWSQAMGEFSLPAPTKANVGEWLGVIDGWTNTAAGQLSRLRLAALERLLATEAQVAAAVRDGLAIGAAPTPPSRPPAQYPTLLPGGERLRQNRLHWWDRFQLADGWLASTARLAVALVIVGAVLVFGASLGNTAITIYNGLMQPMRVTIGETSTTVPALGHARVELPPSTHYAVSTRTADGRPVEQFTADAHLGFAHYVYDIAGAAPLLRHTAVYGNVQPVPEQKLGAPRWSTQSADYLFESAPDSISSKTGGGSRTVIAGLADRAPQLQLDVLGNDSAAAKSLVQAHARWDRTDSRSSLEWLSLAAADPQLSSIVATRLQETPRDVLLHRVAQDAAQGQAYQQVCAQDRAQAAAAPTDADLQYLATRCIDEVAERDRAFLALRQRWPTNPWLLQAAGYVDAEQGRWREALAALDQARSGLPSMRAYIALDAYRIQRLLGSDSPAAGAALARESLPLEQMLALESGEGIGDGPLRAYTELAHGRLDAALAKAGGDADAKARMTRLVAASDGASAAQVERALTLPPEQGLDDQTVWSALGLALRQHRDPAVFVDALRKRGARAEALAQALRFVQQARPGMDAATSEPLLAGLPPELRGQACAAAAVALGKAAPAAWRTTARRLLYASERPYLG